MSLSATPSSPHIPRHFSGNDGIDNNPFSYHYRPQRKNHPRAAASSSSSVCVTTPLSSCRSLTAPSTLSSSRRRSSRSRSRSRSLHRGNVRDPEVNAAAEAGKPSTNSYIGNSRSRSHSRSRLAAARSSSSSSSFHTTTTATTATTANTTTRSNHRSHHGNHQKKYQPAFEGAKFDTSGYCLKHPMMRLCQPTTANTATTAATTEEPSTATTTATSSPVKYQILRKTCPLCGEHALRNERKMRNERNRNAPHGYYRRSDDDDRGGREDRSRSRTRSLLTAGSGKSKREEERRNSIASRSVSSSSSLSASLFGSGGGSGSGRRSSRRESVSRVQDSHDGDDNDHDDGDAANLDYGKLVSRLSVSSTASASAYRRRGTLCSSSASTSSTMTRRRRSTSSSHSHSSSVRSNSSSRNRATLREGETRNDRKRESLRNSTSSHSSSRRSRSDDDRLSVTDSNAHGESFADERNGKHHCLDPPSSSLVPSSMSSSSSRSSSSLMPLALVPSNHRNSYTRHDGGHDNASQNVSQRNDSHTTMASTSPSKEYLDNGRYKIGNAHRIFRNHPNESNDGDNPGTRMRRLHTTEALMNHPHPHAGHCREDLPDGRDPSSQVRDRLNPLRNSSRRVPISGQLKNDRASASIHNDGIDTTRPGSNGCKNGSIPRSKSMCHVDSNGNNNNNNNNNTVSSSQRNNNSCDNNEEGSDEYNHHPVDNDTSTIQTSHSHHHSQPSRSSSITRTIRSKLEERIQSRRDRRRATVSSFHHSLYGGDGESAHVDDVGFCAAASVRGSQYENEDVDNVTLSTRSTAKSLFSSSGGRDISFRVLSTKEQHGDRDRDRPQGQDRHVKSPHQESKRGRSFLRHFGNSGGNHGSGDNLGDRNREKSLVSKRTDLAKPNTTAAPTPSTSSSTLSISTPSNTTASDSSSERNAFSTCNDHHPASRSYSTKPRNRRRSLSRNAQRVLEATSVMDGNKDVEPSLSLKFEVPFHPVTGMCHYHPSVCMAVRDAGNKRRSGKDGEGMDGGWKVVREVCPKCRRGG